MVELHLHTGAGFASELPPEQPDIQPPERRRPNWRDFRRAYPGVITTMVIAIVVLLAIDGWIMSRRLRYQEEIVRLRAGMSDVERRRTDAILASNQNSLRIMVALARRQAQGDKELHLTVAVDSGVMYLEREGALLREMPVQIGPDRTVGTAPDTVHIVAPRGTRTVERVLGQEDAWEVPAWMYSERGIAPPSERALPGALGPAAVVLNGGLVIYSVPDVGPLNDSTYVLPGSIRARAADLKAVLPNLKPGTAVYFY
jgi:hypothetical protein